MTTVRSWARLLGILGAAALWLGQAAPCRAEMIFQVTVNTSSISGTAGSLEFQFNTGGAGALDATATIRDFTGGTLVGTPVFDPLTAGSGTLSPGPLTLQNGPPLTSALHDFNFGSSLRFEVAFTGPAVETPNPALPGSRFSLTLWNLRSTDVLAGDPRLTPLLPLSASIDATLFIDLQPSGTATATASPQAEVTAVPEPASLLLLAVGASALGLYRLRRGRS
jgi:hypothetical protein